MNSLHWGSQIDRVALTKEAYALYMSSKMLSFYLKHADITLWSDHLSYCTFLERNTFNSKVNNWPMKIEEFQSKFEYIKGMHSVLADPMIHLVSIDPDRSLYLKLEGQGCKYCIYDLS